MENSELLKNIDDKISARQAELQQIISEHSAFQRGVDQQLQKFQQAASHTEGMIMELQKLKAELTPEEEKKEDDSTQGAPETAEPPPAETTKEPQQVPLELVKKEPEQVEAAA